MLWRGSSAKGVEAVAGVYKDQDNQLFKKEEKAKTAPVCLCCGHISNRKAFSVKRSALLSPAIQSSGVVLRSLAVPGFGEIQPKRYWSIAVWDPVLTSEWRCSIYGCSDQMACSFTSRCQKKPVQQAVDITVFFASSRLNALLNIWAVQSCLPARVFSKVCKYYASSGVYIPMWPVSV